MKLELTHYGITATIETEHDDLGLNEVIEDFVKPLLIASGFQAKSVEEWFAGEDYVDSESD